MPSEECAENRQFVRDLQLLDSLQQFPPVKTKSYLCRIGHDLHGHFDPHHVDFEILCGTIHTEKASIAFPYISIFFNFISIIFFAVLGMYYFLPLMAIKVPFSVLLRFAINKKNHRKMIPFLIFSFIEAIFRLLTIITFCVLVFNPHLPAYILLKSVCETNMVDFQLAVLFVVLLFSIDFFLIAYVNWNIFFHYVYLLHCNTNSCCHTDQCPGRKDVDPKFHRKTLKPKDVDLGKI